jgi:uncharacterized protein YndB with AHSA1/START domain
MTMAQEPLVIERTLPVPSNRVWRAITDVDQMKQWYFDVPAFRPEVGTAFTFVGTDPEGNNWVHLCKVTEVVPQQKLSHTWKYEGHEGNSMVTWELFPEGAGTRVKLTHAGLETFPPLKSFARENFAGGWTEIIGTMLPRFLEKQKQGV